MSLDLINYHHTASIENGISMEIEVNLEESELEEREIHQEVEIEERDVDIKERERLSKFWDSTCNCTTYKGGPCNRAFSIEYIRSIRDQCLSLDRQSLDLVLMGQLMANVRRSTSLTNRTHCTKQREREHTTYYHQGIKV